MTQRGESMRVMHPLFQGDEGGSTPTSPLSAKSLHIEKITFDAAKELNRRWHSRLPRFGTGSVKSGRNRFLCFGATHADRIFAVAIWSPPAARGIPPIGWLELRRLAAGPDAPRNTCSRMLRIMELLIRRDRPDIGRLISYQDTEAHTGAIYRAAGWKDAAIVNGREWNCQTRPRPDVQSKADKIRWEKIVAR